ncbi:hypothetical protein J3R30DRAFT_3703255 [Lentinula aciculospora]|uniref:Uncharacterized protein n=1 Tax=Lentinula aciculospora TaxID=153920 RepID=A0A9W9AAS2_9AGAR|nr:hypothetical protein J3R30DRAFT_3703255 [Lentinula aciculospora]
MSSAVLSKGVSYKAIITAFYAVNAGEPTLSTFPPGLPTINPVRIPNKIKERVHEFFKNRFRLFETEVEFGKDAVYMVGDNDPFQMDVTWGGEEKKWSVVVEKQESRTTTHQTRRAVNDTREEESYTSSTSSPANSAASEDIVQNSLSVF